MTCSKPLQISIGLSNSLRNEADAEKYKDLRALLRLLTNLCSKDLVPLFAPANLFSSSDPPPFSEGKHGVNMVSLPNANDLNLHIANDSPGFYHMTTRHIPIYNNLCVGVHIWTHSGKSMWFLCCDFDWLSQYTMIQDEG